MADCCKIPSRTISVGSPQMRERKRMLSRLTPLSRVLRASSVAMGTMPCRRGRPKSCMGTEARSLSSIIRTNSMGSNWPICRLPVNRRPRISRAYSSTVRKNAVIITYQLLFHGVWTVFQKILPNAIKPVTSVADFIYL